MAVLLWAALCPALAAPPAPPSRPSIYSCTDAQGRRLSSDRPIPECQGQAQRLHNRDGSVRGEARPLLSPDEQARLDAAAEGARRTEAQRQELARRDRNLLGRFPNEASHDRARQRELAPVQRQLDELLRKLAAQPASAGAPGVAREGAERASWQVLQDRLAERDRINQRFDAELQRLRQLWAGAAPGSLGPLAASPVPPPGEPASAP